MSKRWLPVLLAWALAHAALYAMLNPLWQAPDEPGHVEHACLIAQRGLLQGLQPGDQDPSLQQRVIRSLAANDFWSRVRRATPDPLPTRFSEDPFLRSSGRQVGDESALYYLLPALICRLPGGLDLQVRLMRLVSCVYYVLLVWAIWWAAEGVWPGEAAPVVAAAGAAAGMPMLAFLGGAVNNDILAALLSALAFGFLVRWVSAPPARAAVLALACAVMACAIMATLAKKTALFLIPLAGLACCIALYRQWRGWRTRVRWAALAGLVAIVIAFAWPSDRPWGWSGRWQPWGGGRSATAAHEGGYGALVVDATARGYGRLMQALSPEQAIRLRGQPVLFSAWVRAPRGSATGPVRLAVQEGDRSTERVAALAGDWQRVEVSHEVSPTASQLRVVVAPGAGGSESEIGSVAVDDARLVVVEGQGENTPDNGGDNLLRNPGFERGTPWGIILVEPVARSWQAAWLNREAAPDAPWQRKLLYLALLFPGFWGNFGWLQVPMPVAVYAGLAAICGLALAGLVLPGQGRTLGKGVALPDAARWLGLGLALALAQNLVPMWQHDWQPQARYLFPALVPVFVFFITGLRIWSRRWHLRHGLPLYLLGFLLLDLYALFGVLMPHYYP